MSIEKDLKNIAEAVVSMAESLQEITMILENPSVDTLNVAIPAPVTTPAVTPVTTPAVITIESLDNLAMQVNEMKGGDGVFIMEVLAKYDATSLTELDPEYYEDFKRIMDTA